MTPSPEPRARSKGVSPAALGLAARGNDINAVFDLKGSGGLLGRGWAGVGALHGAVIRGAGELVKWLIDQAAPLGVLGQHHATSHQIGNPAKADEVAKIDAYHMELVQYYLRKLRSIQDGDGTLLDHVIVQVGGGLGNPGEHAVIALTNLIFGGKSAGITGNTHIAYRVEDYVPQANLLITNLGLAGVNIDKLGDSTGRLKEIPL